MIDNNVNWEDYCAIDRMNPSTIVHGFHSMKRLKAAIDGKWPEETDTMRLGSGIHALLLEPDVFEERFVVLPEFEKMPENVTLKGAVTESKNTTFYRTSVREFGRRNAGKTMLKRSQYDNALCAIESLRSRPYIAKCIDACEKEVTLFGEVMGVPFKGRVDLLRRKRPFIADIKTTNNCEKHTFGRLFARLRYDCKMAIYRELVRQNAGKDCDVAIICQEPEGDFDNTYVPIHSVVLDNAWTKVQMKVAEYKQCLESGVWPGVDGGKNRYELAIPNWAMEDEVDWQSIADSESEEVEVYF